MINGCGGTGQNYFVGGPCLTASGRCECGRDDIRKQSLWIKHSAVLHRLQASGEGRGNRQSCRKESLEMLDLRDELCDASIPVVLDGPVRLVRVAKLPPSAHVQYYVLVTVIVDTCVPVTSTWQALCPFPWC